MTSAKRLADTLVGYLSTQGEMALLPEVVKQLSARARAVDKQGRVVVTSSYKLGSEELKYVEAYVRRTLGQKLPIVSVIDPSLVAGFTLQIGDTFIDASTRGKLENLGTELAK